MTTFVEIHVIQTVPPSCLNRDDTGSPKSAIFGGTERARVSSQAWKKATRTWFSENLGADQLGLRTKELPRLVANATKRLDDSVSDADAIEAAVTVLGVAGLKAVAPKKPKKSDDDAAGDPLLSALAFLSAAQVSALASFALAELSETGSAKEKAKEIKAAADTAHSIDIALFGRMVAEAKNLNVDAACQVAHAIGVGANTTEFDFYTATDDVKSSRDDADSGGAMMGTVEYNSATLYRYAVVDVDALVANLGSGEGGVQAARLFVEGFTRSMPTGRQNTFAARTLPYAVQVVVREDQPMSLAGAFVRALDADDVESAALAALLSKQDATEKMYDMAPRASWTVSEDSGTTLADALDGLLTELS